MSKKKKLLSEEQKDNAVKQYEQGNLSILELSQKFKVPFSTLRNYITNKRSPVQNKIKISKQKAYQFKHFATEEWKKLKLPTNYQYEISNFGRIKSYGLDGVPYLVNGSSKMGYQTFAYTDMETGKRTSQFVHRLVASHFIKNTSLVNKVVIHIDGNKANNRANNLKWGNQVEAGNHGNAIKAKNEKINGKPERKTKGKKLNLAKVEMLRKLLADPKRKTRKKMIAKQFGISEMTLYRIQNGDMWNTGSSINYTKSTPKVLSDATVLSIKKLLNDGKLNQKQIAEKKGLTEAVISRIKLGKTYKHVG